MLSMSKITDYLRQHLAGEVRDDAAAQAYFSEDGGIFAATTLLAVYPRTTNDVRKAVRFRGDWRNAEPLCRWWREASAGIKYHLL